MPEERYKNREIDNMYEHLLQRMSALDSDMKDSFQKVYSWQEKLDKNQQYTNSKVKRLIMALVAVGAFSIGIGIKEAAVIISMFI